MIQSEKIVPINYYEKNVIDDVEKISSVILDCLDIPENEKLTRKFLNFFQTIWSKMPKNTKYRAYKKLVHVVMYIFLKMRGNNITVPEIIEKPGLNRKEFNKYLKQVVKCYPAYYRRDRKFITIIKMYNVKKTLNFKKNFIDTSCKILDKVWPYVSNTKEEVIAGVVCTLTMIYMSIDNIPISQVCNSLRIEMSAVSYQVKNNIFTNLGVLDFKGLKRSKDQIVKIIDNLISSEFR